jgi:hypothetical protein
MRPPLKLTQGVAIAGVEYQQKTVLILGAQAKALGVLIVHPVGLSQTKFTLRFLTTASQQEPREGDRKGDMQALKFQSRLAKVQKCEQAKILCKQPRKKK